MAILTFQNWLKFTFSPFQNGQNQNANNFQDLKFTKRAILSSQNWSRLTFSSCQQVIVSFGQLLKDLQMTFRSTKNGQNENSNSFKVQNQHFGAQKCVKVENRSL